MLKDLLNQLQQSQPHFIRVKDLCLFELPGFFLSTELSPDSFPGLAHQSRQSLESDLNRCFVVADLLDSDGWENPTAMPAEDLLLIAGTLATRLREALLAAFPAEHFVVEIIGAEGVEDEPLELCVSFYRKGD